MSTTTDVSTQSNGSAATATRPRVEIPSKHVTQATIEGLAARIKADGEREQVEVEQPFTGKPLGWVPKCTPDDVRAAVARAREVQERWRRTSFAERRAIFLRFHDLVLQRQEELLDLLQLESGKARRHAFEEILDVSICSRYYANTAEKHLKTRRRRGAFPVLTAAWEHHHPLGVVGVISPWNYPLTLAISDSLPALLAGNGVVLKPDSQTPFIAIRGVQLMEEAGVPEGLMQIVTGSGSELGEHIVSATDYIMFTGSTGVGQTVAEQAGRELKGASMELGGKNAMIVMDDVSMARAVDGAERALFSNSGQLCISIERLFVHEKVADEFQRRLIQRIGKMKLAVGLDYGADMGSLISESQLETVREHVEDATGKGAEVLAGGNARPDIGPYFHEPTLLGNVGEGMTLFRDETFGPVVAVSRFSDVEDVIRRANDSDYGLNFSIWTKDTARGRQIAERLQAGTVNINEGYSAAWASVDAPMGGMKMSGLGRRHGAVGIQKYTEQQTVAVQRVLPIAPLPITPPRVWARLISWGLALLRRLPGVR